MLRRLVEPAHPTRQLRLAVRDETRKARSALRGDPPDVHSARRALKRARALVRLGRAAWKPPHRHRLGRSLRDAGRPISLARDSEALVEAVGRLSTQTGPSLAESLEVLGDRLRVARNRALAEADDTDRSIAAARRELQSARRTLKRHPPRGHGRGVAVLGPGLLRIHHRGREALARVQSAPLDPEAYHELRKRAKDLRYTVDFLEPVWPEVLSVWASELHVLTDRLGEGNDLTVLLHNLDVRPPLGRGLDTDLLTWTIRDIRSARWAAGLELATRFWAQPSEDFVREVLGWAEA